MDNVISMETKMPVHQLIYVSLAQKKMLKSDLYIILRKARKNNEHSDVTGLLIYSDEYFIQVLEGNKEVVKNLFKKISEDTRHSDIQILEERETSERAFLNWKMAYSTPSLRDLANWSGLKNATNINQVMKGLQQDTSHLSGILTSALKNQTHI
jgi:hypothetical protein